MVMIPGQLLFATTNAAKVFGADLLFSHAVQSHLTQSGRPARISLVPLSLTETGTLSVLSLPLTRRRSVASLAVLLQTVTKTKIRVKILT